MFNPDEKATIKKAVETIYDLSREFDDWTARPRLKAAFREAKADRGIDHGHLMICLAYFRGLLNPETPVRELCYLGTDYVTAFLLGCRLGVHGHGAVEASELLPRLVDIQERDHA